MAVCLGLLSLTIVWSEVTFSVAPHNQEFHLSFFAFLVYAGHKFQNYITVEVCVRAWVRACDADICSVLPLQILSIAIVAYLSLCAYFTAFRVRIFNLYNLAPRHSTDEFSLLFSAV